MQMPYSLFNMRNLFYSIITLLLLAGCATQGQDGLKADKLYKGKDSVLTKAEQYSDTIVIKYAKGLKVSYQKDGVHVTISNPDPSAKSKQAEEIVVSKPANRFICTTALQLGNFEILGLEDKIVGINSLRNLFSPAINSQLESGKTITIGREGNFNVENVIAAQPDYIFVSASKHGGYESLKETGITLIPHHGYKETHPLAQAEWIKLVGLLTGESRKANAMFADIEKKYNTLKAEVAKKTAQKTKPTIISGRQLRDGWYFVGGKSYMAQLFADAGADYLMKDNGESGGVTLDFEAVYAKGIDADYWQTDGSFAGEYSMSDLAKEDERYATMKAYKNGNVLFCNLSQTPYRELAGVQPQLLLADFVKAFYPELLPNYTPKFYKKIK